VRAQVRLVAEDSVEQRVLEMQQWKREHGQAPAGAGARAPGRANALQEQEFDGGSLLRFFGDL
jgi:hypothetical protein